MLGRVPELAPATTLESTIASTGWPGPSHLNFHSLTSQDWEPLVWGKKVTKQQIVQERRWEVIVGEEKAFSLPS